MRLSSAVGLWRWWTALGAVLWVGQATDALALGVVTESQPARVHQRSAIAIGQDRTTVWMATEVEGVVGPIGVIAAVPVGAVLDLSTTAWFSALHASTTPRVLPPLGLEATCPDDPETHPIHIVGGTESDASMIPLDVQILVDVDSVSTWVSGLGVDLSPTLTARLLTLESPDVRFVAIALDGSAGSWTPTLRWVVDGGDPVLPVFLVEAGQADLVMTHWVIGSGPATLGAAPTTALDFSGLTFDAFDASSNYEPLRHEQLADFGTLSAVRETASHDLMVQNISIGDGTNSITGIVTEYFERAVGTGVGSPSAVCIADAGVAFASNGVLPTACPRADLGVVEGVDTCVEAPQAGQVDPDVFRCGPAVDDLAIALSGLVPGQVHISRFSQLVASGQWAHDQPVTLSTTPAESMTVVNAGIVDLSGCEMEPVEPPPTNPPGQPPESVPDPDRHTRVRYTPVYDIDHGACGCSGTEVTYGDYYIAEESETSEVYYREEADCSGDTESYAEESYGEEGCGGDTSDTYYDSDESESSSDSETTDDGGCSSDTSDTQETDDDGGCGGDTTETGDSYEEDEGVWADVRSGAASVSPGRQKASPRRRRAPRLSTSAFALFLFLAPLRRWTRKRRRSVIARATQGKTSRPK